MEYGLIKDTTLQGIADGLRAKKIVPELRDIAVDFDLYKTPNLSSFDNAIPTSAEPYMGSYKIFVPEAISLRLEFTVGVYTDDTYVSGSAGKFSIGTDSNPYAYWSGTFWETKDYSVKVSANTCVLEYETNNNEGISFGVTMKIYALDTEGNEIQLIRPRVFNSLTPSDISEAINNMLPLPPEESFNFTGNCSNLFANDNWGWFIDNYSDKLTFVEINNTSYMFKESKREYIPIEINMADKCTSTEMFNGCANLVELPKITLLNPGTKLFYYCYKLESLNDNKLKAVIGDAAVSQIFAYCYRLRNIEGFFDNLPDYLSGSSIYGFYSVFENCHLLDETKNLPFIYGSNASYIFGSCFKNCYRLKEVTFRNPVLGVSTKTCTLDLSTNTGWSAADLTVLGASKQVTDDASYQALKDDPDWWTRDVAYSRYNHTSAVNTINSLPDVSINGTNNTIKFKKTAGSATDGGAINNLTAEEIAVAAAKGWTVTLV